jgi:hypothetical protein
VTVLEQFVELAPSEASTESTPEPTQRELVLDVVGKGALVRAAGSDNVAMEPSREGSAVHSIGEHHAGLVGHVLGLDGLPERTHLRAQDDDGARGKRGCNPLRRSNIAGSAMLASAARDRAVVVVSLFITLVTGCDQVFGLDRSLDGRADRQVAVDRGPCEIVA